ncbi:MAG: delta-class carbonic anhydrase, partial [Ketobacter sp.]
MMTTRVLRLAGTSLCLTALASLAVAGSADSKAVSDKVIAEQRANLAKNTSGIGAGPQAPRDIDAAAGNNPIVFGTAPDYSQMNLCNIHFHKSAEHKGGEFTKYVGNGDGHGWGTGYAYSGKLSKSESKPLSKGVCASDHGSLQPGDTIEVHYVHSTAPVQPGKGLGSCLSDVNK